MKKSIPTQSHLFVKYIADLPLRHQRELMVRPFFSLSKKPRYEPIEYTSPDGKVFVRVTGGDKGIATIYDQDFLIAWTSLIIHWREIRKNDISSTVHFYPQDILETIHRETGGREYKLAREAWYRLATTKIETNIRTDDKRKYAMFNWIDAITDVTDKDTTYSHGTSVRLSDWLYEGITMDGGVLKLSSEYFNISGAYERWLYQLARTHAGGAGPKGFSISFSTLYFKSGTVTNSRAFKYALTKIIAENALPDFNLHVPDTSASDPILHITHRHHKGVAMDPTGPMLADDSDTESVEPVPSNDDETSHPSEIPAGVLAQLKAELPHYLPAFLKSKFEDDCRRRGVLPFVYGQEFMDFARAYANANGAAAMPRPALPNIPISADLAASMRAEFPKWDIAQLYELFDNWIKTKKRPANIDKAFYSFSKTHISKNPI